MVSTNTLTPPLLGNSGLPLIGETLAFIKNPFAFLEERVQKYGPISKTNILGRKAVIISGPESCEVLLNKQYCKRAGSMPKHIQELFGGKSLPLLDSETHKNRKINIMQAFSYSLMASYLPDMQNIVESNFERWEKKDYFNFINVSKNLSIEAICTNIFGLRSKSDIYALSDNYTILTKGFSCLPVNISGSVFNKSLKARERIFQTFERIISEHRKEKFNDGLSAILNYNSEITPLKEGPLFPSTEIIPLKGPLFPSTEIKIPESDVKLEIHHLVIAGFIIFSEFVTTLIELSKNSDIREKLETEIKNNSPDGPVTIEIINKMTYLNQVIMEIKRLCPIVPNVFSIANQTFEFKGYTVPEGCTIIWALRSTNIDKNTYTEPLKFDPERFSDERAEHKKHKHAFVPQGAGDELDHRCAGLDYTTYFMAMFIIVLLRKYKWDLQDKNPEYKWEMLPPEPKNGFKVKFDYK